MANLSFDPPVSEKQRKAMWAAREGRSTLGIPASVGKKFVGPVRDADSKAAAKGLLTWAKEEAEEHADDAAPMAAGCILMDMEGNVLLLRRSTTGDHAGKYGLPGGMIEGDEKPDDAARREIMEETGYKVLGPMHEIDRVTSNDVDYATYFRRVQKQFKPKLNSEHTGHVWAPLDGLPENLHPGCKRTLAMLEQGSLNPHLASDSAYAFDKSVRTTDAEGRMHVAKSNISKANICPYMGKEIPEYEQLGLEPDRVYQLLRDPEELRKGASSFNNIPILIKHEGVSADDWKPDLVIGSTGTDAAFEDPYLTNSLVFWAGPSIKDIESGKRKELSCSYRYKAVMEPGSMQGIRFDGRMTDIKGNHVALVEEGRAGKDVAVGDSSENIKMAALPLTKILKQTVYNGLQPILAKDASIDAKIFKGVTTENFKARKPAILKHIEERTKGKLAKDASLGQLHELMDSLDGPQQGGGGDAEEEDPIPIKAEKTEVQPETEAEDDDLHSKLSNFLHGKLSPEEVDAVHSMAMEHHQTAGATHDSDEGMGEENSYDEESEAEDAETEGTAEGEESLKQKGAKDKHAKDKHRAKDKRRAHDNPPPFKGMPKTGGKMHGSDKRAHDQAITRGEAQRMVQLAQDEMRKTFRAIEEARSVVRPWVGELRLSFDSAEAVYRHALKARTGKDFSDVTSATALRQILEVMPKNGAEQAVRAMDAAPPAEAHEEFFAMFPGAANIQL